MGKLSVQRVCFDTSAWTAILNSESVHNVAALRRWMERVEQGLAILLVPAVVITEVAAGPDELQVQGFRNVLLQPYIEQLDITTAIAIRAGQLRRDVINDSMKLKTLDALIVAAAEHHRADFLISLDERHIIRMDGKYGLTMKIGLPRTGLPAETSMLPFEE